jgi:MFS family permease
LALVIPLMPIGAALLFPATTAKLSHSVEKDIVGLTLGIAQTAAGVARLVAPLAATSLFQQVSMTSPFFFGAAMVALGGLLAARLPEKK